MLTVPGPLPINQVQRSDESNLFLRVNQKVAGEILQVSNEQVVLSIQGVQVVARLTTPEQMAELFDRRFAQFVVKEFNANTVLLQLVEPELANTSVSQPLNQQETEFISGLLKQIGIKPNEGNKLIVRQMISQGVPVTPEAVNELQTALQLIPGWGEDEAKLAVQIKSYGVPVSAETIKLMAKAPAEVTQTLNNLLGQLEQLTKQSNLPTGLREQITTAIRILSQGIVEGDEPVGNLVQRLKNAVTLLGKTVENELIRSTTTSSNELDRGLMVLSQLRNQLASRGFTSIAGDIDRLNDYLRLVHLPNSESTDPKMQNQWFKIEIPVHFPLNPNNTLDDELVPARLKIAREKDGEDGSKVDPNYTRIVIQMDLAPMQIIEVDLSIVSRLIGLNITTPSEEIRNAAIDELDSLTQDLKELGYETRYSHVESGPVQHSSDDTQLPPLSLLNGTINVEA